LLLSLSAFFVVFFSFLHFCKKDCAMVHKKEAAEILYKEGFEQKDIARMLGLSVTTISKYTIAGNWRKTKQQHDLRILTAESDNEFSLAHQSRVLRMMSEKLSLMVNHEMTIDELKNCLLPKGEIDAVQKLSTTIARRDPDWKLVVRVLREFSIFLKEDNLELAQDIVPHIDKYINEKRKNM
jgi:predicted transcriptional regulator